jgi:hypothetical protein
MYHKNEQVSNRKAKKEEGKNLMQSFIVEHYLNKAVDVYCGGPDVFRGTVEACADNVLTLNNDGKYTHVAIDKMKALKLAPKIGILI